MSQPQLEKDISALESQVKGLVAKGGILDASDQLLSAKDALYARAPADRTWWNNRIRILHTAFKLLTQFKNSERPADKTLVYFAKLMEQINGSTQSSSSTVAQPNKPGASISTRPPAASAKVATAMVTTTTSKPNPAAPTAPAKSSVPTPAPSPAPPKLSVSETVNPSVPPKAPALPKTTSTTAPKKTSAAAPTKQGATATSRPSTTRPSNPSPGPSHPEADSPRDDRPMKKDQPKSKKPQKGKTAAEQHAIGEHSYKLASYIRCR
ncbi:hypothetical protein BDN70DRAFT_939890 [Pholiota conissans]|uniref:Uncharacterized protein n=1 Tax=Pholiota conissans TaxID=109636 RepID=A0A9P5YJ38_9AGAR|nr:hypothetical protein BDN70DRAFT_939890 [Pholiota conissans]